MTRWWKCDLQVATPAWNFTLPQDLNYDLASEEGKRRFADRYMDELIAKGIEVVALADHNTGDWIDLMCSAGSGRGVAVFPGCEVTTGSGADGIHVVVIGDRSKTSRDFDVLLGSALGFDDAHPRFYSEGEKQLPGSSRKTLLQVLEELPDAYLAFAPHALNENGIASGNTIKGQMRWKALHHPRLCAVDPGDCSSVEGDGFNSRFRRRGLDNFPRLKDLAFIHTSDAYELGDLGKRFCWIRMETPTLEALRQAFLDPEARIICSWDSRLAAFPNRDPNRVRHAWLSEVHLGGAIGNSTAPLRLGFHPGLNVLIGGRGSGKSTLVAAIRQIYSGFATLPRMVRQEAEQFAARVFSGSTLSAIHVLPNSQDEQSAVWTEASGSRTLAAGADPVATSFRVRVVNQKELFERVSYDKEDPFAASRSFLAFVDESLSLSRGEVAQPGRWWRSFEDATAEWMAATRDHLKLEADVAQLPEVRASIRDLGAQVAALDAPEALARRMANDTRLMERRYLDEQEREFEALLVRLPVAAEFQQPQVEDMRLDHSEALVLILNDLAAIRSEVQAGVGSLVEAARAKLMEWQLTVDRSDWAALVAAARIDEVLYVEELAAKGIDPKAYGQLKARLSSMQEIESELASKATSAEAARKRTERAWLEVVRLLEERTSRRQELLASIAARSGHLRFGLHSHRDHVGWSRQVRELLSLRSDAFLDDLPQLAGWLWAADEEEVLGQRWEMWRAALATGDFAQLAGKDQAGLRPTWANRLESMDESLRLRLASEVADDIVEIAFLKDGGRVENAWDWQDITQGSPGQKTAAMLGFVLHHGEEPLVLDQPEDDLDTELISNLVVRELRASRWNRQVIVVTHNANIPVNGDAERIVVLENQDGEIRVRSSPAAETGEEDRIPHCGAIEVNCVREDIQNIMEGGIRAFVQRERKYNNEVRAIGAVPAENPAS